MRLFLFVCILSSSLFATLPQGVREFTILDSGHADNDPQVVVNQGSIFAGPPPPVPGTAIPGTAIAIWNNVNTGEVYAAVNRVFAVGATPIWTAFVNLGILVNAQIGIDQQGNGIVASASPITNNFITNQNAARNRVNLFLYNFEANNWTTLVVNSFSGARNETPSTVLIGTDQKGNIYPTTIPPGGASIVPIVWLNPAGNEILSTFINLSTRTFATPTALSSLIPFIFQVATSSLVAAPIPFPLAGAGAASAINVNSIQILANELGNGVLIWTNFNNQLFGATYNVTNVPAVSPPPPSPLTYTSIPGWSAPSLIDSNSLFPTLGLDNVGTGVLMWQNIVRVQLRALRFPVP